MGRQKGSMNDGTYKWHVYYWNFETGEIIKDLGKYTSIPEFNKINGTDITNDIIYKLKKLTPECFTEKRINHKYSFVRNYGHYKFDKINEPVNFKYVVTKRKVRLE